MFVKHFELPFAFIDLDVVFVLGGAVCVLVVDSGFPVFEEVTDHSHIVVLFSRGFVCHLLELGGFNQSGGVPLGHPCAPVEGSQFEVGIDVADIYFGLS